MLDPIRWRYSNLIRLFFYLTVEIWSVVRLIITMVTPRQIKAARALLGWSQQELADRAILSTNAVIRLERGSVDSRTSTLAAVEKALSKGGIEFIPADTKGEGVRLMRPG